ncbi:MAG: type IX secretion system outer membrane channel protein PorV, partial [Chitinophagales bacterium]|nr:type IX secretion system outer membrane channel protein PorV [Chitinophagales bacterium]
TYTPWLRNLVNDIYLAYLTGFWKVDDFNTLSGSLRYFSLGNITFTDQSGNVLQDFRPNEFVFDVAYARKLADKLSAGLDLKYIYSNLATGQYVNGIPIKPANGVAADVSLFYTTEFKMGEKDAYFNGGLNIANIGNKITYTNSIEKDFIPTNMGLGFTLGMYFDEYNQMSLSIDLNKLLVPTPSSVDENGDSIPDYKTESVVGGILGSFSDAPLGFSEEIKEIIFSTGLEYWYNKQFAVRAGYFYEAPQKGNRQFFTVGLGLKYNVFGLDFSYLIPSSNQNNPLDNTLRFTLAFDFASLKATGDEDADVEE